METRKYLDYDGLKTYHKNLSKWVLTQLEQRENLRTMLFESLAAIRESDPKPGILYVTEHGELYLFDQEDNQLNAVTATVDDEQLNKWLEDTLINKSSILIKTDTGYTVAINEDENEKNFLKVNDKGLYISGIEEYTTSFVNDLKGEPDGLATLDSDGFVVQNHHLLSTEELNNINWF